jgi:hypothetical protein
MVSFYGDQLPVEAHLLPIPVQSHLYAGSGVNSLAFLFTRGADSDVAAVRGILGCGYPALVSAAWLPVIFMIDLAIPVEAHLWVARSTMRSTGEKQR